jgi:hypothetical protein
LRHIKPAIAGEPGEQRIEEGQNRGLAPCRNMQHGKPVAMSQSDDRVVRALYGQLQPDASLAMGRR